MYRKPVDRGKDRRDFVQGANRTHKKNLRPAPMRGGYRL